MRFFCMFLFFLQLISTFHTTHITAASRFSEEITRQCQLNKWSKYKLCVVEEGVLGFWVSEFNTYCVGCWSVWSTSIAEDSSAACDMLVFAPGGIPCFELFQCTRSNGGEVRSMMHFADVEELLELPSRVDVPRQEDNLDTYSLSTYRVSCATWDWRLFRGFDICKGKWVHF